jgi:hypothetical protein
VAPEPSLSPVAVEPAPWDEDSMDDTREIPVSGIHPQPPNASIYPAETPEAAADRQAATDNDGISPLFAEPATEVTHPTEIDNNLFDMDDLDTPAFLRQGGNLPD